MIVILSILFILAMLAMTGTIAYFSIGHAVKANKQYELFAEKYGYQFDKAQGNLYYRDNSKNHTEMVINIGVSPFVKKYADYISYPFGQGAGRTVAFVIQGTYLEINFRAFTYIFTGSFLDTGNSGGVFSIVMIQAPNSHIKSLPSNMFYERNTLCEYLQGNLDVNTIHERIKNLTMLKL